MTSPPLTPEEENLLAAVKSLAEALPIMSIEEAIEALLSSDDLGEVYRRQVALAVFASNQAKDMEIGSLRKLHQEALNDAREFQIIIDNKDARIAELKKALTKIREELWIDYCLKVNTSKPTEPQTVLFEARPLTRTINAALSKSQKQENTDD